MTDISHKYFLGMFCVIDVRRIMKAIQDQEMYLIKIIKGGAMKTMSIILPILLVTVSYTLASGGSEVEGLGLMAAFFIAFGVLIVLYQLIPGLTLLGGMLKGIFSQTGKRAPDVSSE